MKDTGVATELHRIAEQHDGELRPLDVVNAARDEASPLHSHFEWNDGEAAERYRLWQARQLIRVVVEFVGPKDSGIVTKVFVSLTSDRQRGGAGYRVLNSVLVDSSQREQLLADALAELTRFQTKYAELKELAGVFAAMRRVKKRDKAAA